MKMRGGKIAYWVCAALLLISAGALISYDQEQAQTGALLRQVTAVGRWLFFGAYIAFYKLLPVFGRGGRWRVDLSKVAVGMLLAALGLIFRWYFSLGDPPITEAANMLFVLGGYLLAASVEKIPAPEEVRLDHKNTSDGGAL